jgi:PAP2 superfamily
MTTLKTQTLAPVLAAVLALCSTDAARADAITDWNIKSAEIVTEAKIGTPPAVRVMALVQTAAHEALRRAGADRTAAQAAIAAAHRTTFAKMLPAQQALTEAAYQAALAALPEGAAKAAGIAAGEAAAQAVLAKRSDDTIAPEAYRPHTTPGAYVPTAAAAVPQWSQRKPWLMTSAAQFRPAAPPALTSVAWVRDFEEVKTLGARASSKRSSEQTEVARFWDYSLPAIYHGVLRSVALQPGRDLAANARLFATVAQAMDDALISVFDAKYHHNFWRPVTAIRNADQDGHDATQREANWASLIDSPMHPEYPSGHSILAAAVATVLKAETAGGALPVLSTTSPTAVVKGATRRWSTLDEFVREVSDARIWGGIHFRSATDTGEAMGKRIGELAVTRSRAD